jgi:hypothetical protein
MAGISQATHGVQRSSTFSGSKRRTFALGFPRYTSGSTNG